jgi:type IV secretion system protein VirB6
MFAAIEAGGGFLGPTLNVLGEATRYCVLMIVMAIICFQAPSLASALTGGAAVQQGVQMIQNARMVAGLRARAPADQAQQPQRRRGSRWARTAPPLAAWCRAGQGVRRRRARAIVHAGAAYKLAAWLGRT